VENTNQNKQVKTTPNEKLSQIGPPLENSLPLIPHPIRLPQTAD